MKNLIPVLLLLNATVVSGQYNYREDTACYHSQWIAVPNDSVHVSFFTSGDGSDLFHIIYRLNRDGALQIMKAETQIASCCFGWSDAMKAEVKDSSRSYYDFEMNWEVSVYAFLSSLTHQELNEYGEYAYAYDPDRGEDRPVMIPADTVYFAFPSIYEIRIHEEKRDESWYGPMYYYDENDYDDQLAVLEISFAIWNYPSFTELFTVDYNELMYALQTSSFSYKDTEWYKMLRDQSYSGFRYKQASCYDRIER